MRIVAEQRLPRETMHRCKRSGAVKPRRGHGAITPERGRRIACVHLPLEAEMPPRERREVRALGRFFEPAIAWIDRALYVAVALFLLAAAFLILVYTLVTFVREVDDDFILAIITLINDVLLVLIVLEVLNTVRDYLTSGTTSLRIFLYVGIISAIRQILALGARTTLGEGVEGAAFRELMIDLGVHAGVVLALAAALWLFGHQDPGDRLAPEVSPGGEVAPKRETHDDRAE
jgi:uncharacterized membrane protein (DUF373 family)